MKQAKPGVGEREAARIFAFNCMCHDGAACGLDCLYGEHHYRCPIARARAVLIPKEETP